MAIKYKARQCHIYNTYYPATAAMSESNSVNSIEIAKMLADKSSISVGDALAMLETLPDVIAEVLCAGKSIRIKGLCSLNTALRSKNKVGSADALTPDQVVINKVSFRPSPNLMKKVREAKLVRIDE